MRRYKAKPFVEYRIIHKSSAGRWIGSIGFKTVKEARSVGAHWKGAVEIVKFKVTEVR